jgi:hypothetical protein
LNCGSCQHQGPSRCRALAASVLLAVTVLFAGCGAVLFVPSPYTPQKVELVYSSQEDITIVRWRISSTAPIGDDLHFQILGENDDQPIDFSHSLFPGGASTCADADGGTCFQYVRRGVYPVGRYPHPVIGIHATYGTLPGELATSRTEDQTLGVDPFFKLTNDQVYVSLTDTVAFEPPYVYPRSYDRTMWSTKGLCVSEVLPTNVSFSPLDAQSYAFPPDLPLSDSGRYCVGIRPSPWDGGDSVVAQGRLATLPEVTNLQQTFTPPVEQSPIIYQIVLDLEIAVPDRCDLARTTIEGLVDKYMQVAGVKWHKLPTINLATNSEATGSSPNCAQLGDGRALPDPTGMAEAVLQQVSSSPVTYQQFHFFYFNNQNFLLPQTLTDSLKVLYNGLMPPAPYSLRVNSWLFTPNPDLVTSMGPSWWMSMPWQSFEDPSLEMTLASYAAHNLPYMSQFYDQSVPLPLLSTDEVAAYAGGFFKICDSSPLVQPVYMSSGQRLYGQSWAIEASDPPGYLVGLLPQLEEPGPSFTPEHASVNFQICTAYCDHPYVSKAGTGVTSWATSPLCAAVSP